MDRSVIIKEALFWGGSIGAILLICAIVAGVMYYVLVIKRRRKWFIEIHEQKKDGRLHSIGRDVLIEKTKHWGTQTLYFLQKKKKVALPPPDDVVDRIKSNQEEVDYLQIERQLFPAERKLFVNYNDPEVNKKVVDAYDKMIDDISSQKDVKKIRERYIYIPINKVLIANVGFKPIPYDVQLTAQRQTKIAEEFFKQKANFWEKYGTAITIGATAAIIIIVCVLAFNFVDTVIKETLQQSQGVANGLSAIADKIGGTKPPV